MDLKNLLQELDEDCVQEVTADSIDELRIELNDEGKLKIIHINIRNLDKNLANFLATLKTYDQVLTSSYLLRPESC